MAKLKAMEDERRQRRLRRYREYRARVRAAKRRKVQPPSSSDSEDEDMSLGEEIPWEPPARAAQDVEHVEEQELAVDGATEDMGNGAQDEGQGEIAGHDLQNVRGRAPTSTDAQLKTVRDFLLSLRPQHNISDRAIQSIYEFFCLGNAELVRNLSAAGNIVILF